MNKVSIFEHPEFGRIRTLEIDGKIWFCASDVAAALGYSNPRDAVVRHCKPMGVVVYDTPTRSAVQKIKYISEGNVYRLIAGSKLPSAEKFESWIFDELVPETLKNGGYLLKKNGETDNELLARAILLAQNRIKERDSRISALEKENNYAILKLKLQAPKVQYYDKVLQSQSTYTTTQIAKELGMTAGMLNKRLRWAGIQFRQSGQWLLKAPYQNQGYTATRTHVWESRTGETGTAMLTVWTEKGRLFIHYLFEAYRLRSQRYDLLLTDIQMPETDGYGILELLRASNMENAKTIPVIAVTARVDDDNEYLSGGFSGCIHKPFSMEELINTVAQVIGEKDRKEYAPDFSLILSGEDNREEMLALFIEESRKDLAALTAALDRQDKEAAASSILHKNLPLWETVRLDFPLSHLRELVTEPATEWTNRQSMEMRDIIRAVEKLIVYAEKYGRKAYENNPDY